MGSPYFVHAHVHRVHVVKTTIGFERILLVVRRSMGLADSTKVDEHSPEWVVLRDLLLSYQRALSSHSRVVVYLEARYEWRGWEKFQRVIVFDFSNKAAVPAQILQMKWEHLPFQFILGDGDPFTQLLNSPMAPSE